MKLISVLLLVSYIANAHSQGCECVPYYQCDEGGTIITDGAGIIDVRAGAKQCESYLEVCCNHPDKTIKPVIKPITDNTCGSHTNDIADLRLTNLYPDETQFGEFPWMAAILRQENVGTKSINLYACGGSLIHPTVILTVAHCVSGLNADQVIVRVGEWDTQQTIEPYLHQDIHALDILIHENFHSGNLHNDVALIILKEQAIISPHVRTICLPEIDYDYVSNQDCYATGWGKDKFGEDGKYQNILKKVQLPMVPNNACQEKLRVTRLGPRFVLDDSFICAGGKIGVDTCQGDGGSPLVCEERKGNSIYYVQTGIVAWGIGCAEENVPAVYANVLYSTTWISNKLESYNIKI